MALTSTPATGASSPFDIERARRDTPGVARVAHLNNAGAALPPTQVTDAVIAHLRRESEMGGYEAAEAAADQVEHTYAAIAQLIGARVDEIAVVENATRAWDMAFYGLTLGPGDRILTARAEYASNVIAFLQVARRTGAIVEVIENDESGQLSVSDLRRRLDDGNGPVKLVAITHVPTQGGLVNPAEEVGAATREAGVPSCSTPASRSARCPSMSSASGATCSPRPDASSSVAPEGPDSSTSAATSSTKSSHRSSTCTQRPGPPLTNTRSAPMPDASRTGKPTTRPRSALASPWTTPCPGAWKPSRNASPASPNAYANACHTSKGSACTTKASAAAASSPSPSTASPPSKVQQHLSDRGVNVSVSLLDYARLDLPNRGLPDLVRASVHYYNTDDELDQLIRALPGSG